MGILKVVSYAILKEVIFPPDLDMRHPDHAIIATAKAIQADCENRKTIMVSRDINMRVICDSIGIEAQDYISEKAAPSFEELYNGFMFKHSMMRLLIGLCRRKYYVTKVKQNNKCTKSICYDDIKCKRKVGISKLKPS